MLNRISLSLDKVANDDVCEGILETMQGEASEDFYTVACDSNYESRYNVS